MLRSKCQCTNSLKRRADPELRRGSWETYSEMRAVAMPREITVPWQMELRTAWGWG